MARRESAVLRRFVSFVRNSPWLMIAAGLHVIVAAALSLAYILDEGPRPSESALSVAIAPRVPEAERPVLREEILERNKIPEAEVRQELVALKDLDAFVPLSEIEPEQEIDWHQSLGDPTGTGEDDAARASTNIGVGKLGQRGSGVTPHSIVGGRPGGTGRNPTPGRPGAGLPVVTEEAVLEGLCWLMRHQNEDGSWSADSLHEHCTVRACIPADPELDSSFDTGMTALALLAFLGQGLSPLSKVVIVDEALGRPPRPAGEIVKRGIRWLMERQKPDGSFSDSEPFALPENDTLSTMALCEAYALSPSLREVKKSAQRAIDFLVAAQKRGDDGVPSGWGFGAQSDLEARRARGELDEEAYDEARRNLDPSVTCWVVMALASAKSCRFQVPDSALEGALAAAKREAEPGARTNLACASERFDRHSARHDALNMLVRAFAGGSIDDPYLAGAARAIAADVPRVSKDGLSVDFYYWYFATLALNQYDGPDSPRVSRKRGEFWEPWERGLVNALLGLQDRSRERDDCARGGWLQEARGNRRGRALYNTALNVLTLEVYYRYTNVFGAVGRKRR